jgi:hypothetical protein
VPEGEAALAGGGEGGAAALGGLGAGAGGGDLLGYYVIDVHEEPPRVWLITLPPRAYTNLIDEIDENGSDLLFCGDEIGDENAIRGDEIGENAGPIRVTNLVNLVSHAL